MTVRPPQRNILCRQDQHLFSGQEMTRLSSAVHFGNYSGICEILVNSDSTIVQVVLTRITSSRRNVQPEEYGTTSTAPLAFVGCRHIAAVGRQLN